jgi:putative membrane protein
MSAPVENTVLRDFLALERTKLSNERTYLAYVRTSLYFLLGGFAFIKIEDFENTKYLGYISISISLFLMVFGTIKFLVIRKRIRQRQSLSKL